MNDEQKREYHQLCHHIGAMLDNPEWGLFSWVDMLHRKMKRQAELLDIWRTVQPNTKL